MVNSFFHYKSNNMGSRILLLVVGGMLFSNCCWLAGVTDELADLAITYFETPEEVNLGEAFNILADVVNKESEVKCTSTDYADAVIDVIQVFKKHQNGDLELVGRATYPQEGLKAEQTIRVSETLSIGSPGDYLVQFLTDTHNDVDERSEYNNETSLGNISASSALIGTGNNSAYRWISVSSGSQDIQKTGSRPVVEFKYGTVVFEKSDDDETI